MGQKINMDKSVATSGKSTPGAQQVKIQEMLGINENGVLYVIGFSISCGM